MVKVDILEIICIVHANDILAGRIPHTYTYHYLGSYISNNTEYPIFVVVEGENNDKS